MPDKLCSAKLVKNTDIAVYSCRGVTQHNRSPQNLEQLYQMYGPGCLQRVPQPLSLAVLFLLITEKSLSTSAGGSGQMWSHAEFVT